MAYKLYAFIEAFHVSVPIAADLRIMMEKKIPIHLFTDWKEAFDVITHGKRPSKRRLAIDITVLREAYYRYEIDRIGLVRGENNPADGMTKQKLNRMLEKIIGDCKDHKVKVEWITHKPIHLPNDMDTKPRDTSNDIQSEECDSLAKIS